MKFLPVRLWLQTAFAVSALSLFGSPILAADSAQIVSTAVQATDAQDDEIPVKTVGMILSSQSPNNNGRFPLPEDFVLRAEADPSGETNHDGFFLRIYPAGSGSNMQNFLIDPFTDYKLRVIPPSSPQLDLPVEMPVFAP